MERCKTFGKVSESRKVSSNCCWQNTHTHTHTRTHARTHARTHTHTHTHTHLIGLVFIRFFVYDAIFCTRRRIRQTLCLYARRILAILLRHSLSGLFCIGCHRNSVFILCDCNTWSNKRIMQREWGRISCWEKLHLTCKRGCRLLPHLLMFLWKQAIWTQIRLIPWEQSDQGSYGSIRVTKAIYTWLLA